MGGEGKGQKGGKKTLQNKKALPFIYHVATVYRDVCNGGPLKLTDYYGDDKKVWAKCLQYLSCKNKSL